MQNVWWLRLHRHSQELQIRPMTGTPAVDNFCVVTRDLIRRDALHNPQSVLAELHMQLSNLFTQDGVL